MNEPSRFASRFGGIGRALSAPDYRTYWYAHVVSIYLAMIVGSQALGAQAMGLIAEFTGFRLAMGGGAALALILVVVMAPFLWRQRQLLEAEGGDTSQG